MDYYVHITHYLLDVIVDKSNNTSCYIVRRQYSSLQAQTHSVVHVAQVSCDLNVQNALSTELHNCGHAAKRWSLVVM